MSGRLCSVVRMHDQFLHMPQASFILLTLYRDGLPIEEHPFSISSSPADQTVISSTIKESGDFTRTIKHTKLGDLARIRGP